MLRFFFTYGTSGQPFRGGWTEVHAENVEKACEAFQAYHPSKEGNLLACSSVYTEAEFKKTEMYRTDNFGARCHEIITLRRESAE